VRFVLDALKRGEGERIAMEKLTSLLLGVALMLVTAPLAFSQTKTNDRNSEKKMKEAESKKTERLMQMTGKNIEVMQKLFSAVERYDEQQQISLCQRDVEFHWPRSLYGGSRPGWDETWLPLQPTAAERKMDPRIVAASEDVVVVLWHQRGVSQTGDRFDGEALGLYHLRDGKLARAQMFYFDTAAVAGFLAKAITPELKRQVQAVLDRLKALPTERRRKVQQAYGAIKMAPLDQRQLLITSDEFKSAFSDNERDLLNSMLDLGSSHAERRPEGQATPSKPRKYE
jgi:ketosteroid isomerase-like protein